MSDVERGGDMSIQSVPITIKTPLPTLTQVLPCPCHIVWVPPAVMPSETCHPNRICNTYPSPPTYLMAQHGVSRLHTHLISRIYTFIAPQTSHPLSYVIACRCDVYAEACLRAWKWQGSVARMKHWNSGLLLLPQLVIFPLNVYQCINWFVCVPLSSFSTSHVLWMATEARNPCTYTTVSSNVHAVLRRRQRCKETMEKKKVAVKLCGQRQQ